ncbi:GrlR family regulatory protein [Shewanella dokdonensis]|uniref:Type III secretion system (T3SS) negative regulator GrlR n=1 Tax=Shewanella dokdonensis TaxID=712036 RepID=A0ABX8DFU3_9GAMM|nr:GrlR family regulatory protein [Shewanella dokdonensis]MCL1075988.1 hypothetical protein [Shewanella dokdonensis]QVK23255.1 hypothetical protein KHX94_19885 [Shewanella dokdonensis]
MKDGIYHVVFSSNVGALGEGIAVFNGEGVNGGDYGYVYTGTINYHESNFVSRLTIKRWNSSTQSIFGNLPEFQLELNGHQTESAEFIAEGNVIGQPSFRITIKGRYLSKLA